MITPVISLLSAVEGIGIATPVLTPFVVPLTVIVPFALFLFQKSGSECVGHFFGPVMALWFGVIALIGVLQIAAAPRVLAALSPAHAAAIFAAAPTAGFLVLGAVALAITGGEALYADMGHFGRFPDEALVVHRRASCARSLLFWTRRADSRRQGGHRVSQSPGHDHHDGPTRAVARGVWHWRWPTTAAVLVPIITVGFAAIWRKRNEDPERPLVPTGYRAWAVLLVWVVTENILRVAGADRIEASDLGGGFWQIKMARAPLFQPRAHRNTPD